MELPATVVTLEGVRISYRDSGEPTRPAPQPPVILVHGMGGDGHTWDRFARALTARRRRVIIVDLRGHGRSAHTPTYLFDEFAFDVLRLCDLLELTQVDFVGHSLGGYAASVIAQVRPDLVRSLVIEESPLPRRRNDPHPDLSVRFPSLAELWHATTSILRSPRAVFAFDRSMTSTALTQFHTPNPQWWQRLPDITAIHRDRYRDFENAVLPFLLAP